MFVNTPRVRMLVNVGNRNTSSHVTRFTRQWARTPRVVVYVVLGMDSSWWSSRQASHSFACTTALPQII